MGQRAAILGGGPIGRGWAVTFARAGWQVRLWTPPGTASHEVPETLAGACTDLAEAGLLADADAAALAARIDITSELEEALAGAAWVQVATAPGGTWPAVAELAAPNAILASTQAWQPAPPRGCAERHLLTLSPAAPQLLPLVELVPGAATSATTMAMAEETLAALGMRPLLVRHPTGRGVARRLEAALQEAALGLLEDGLCGPEEIDIALRHGLGPAWAVAGLFESADLAAPGGIREAARGWDRPPPERLLDEIEAARRIRLLEGDLEARQHWRARRLLALAAHTRQASSEIGD